MCSGVIDESVILVKEFYKPCIFMHKEYFNTSAETQSGLPLLLWSCYASVIQCDIIQYLMFLFYYNTEMISFLAIYNDTILCTIF